MKIQKIQLNNFRGFKGEHNIDFDPNLNVFVGRNGAGKSSILDAVGMLLNNFLNAIDFGEFRKEFRKSDINSNAEESIIQLLIDNIINNSNNSGVEDFKGIYLDSFKSIDNDEEESDFRFDKIESNFTVVHYATITKKIWNLLKKSPDNFNVPILRFYRFTPFFKNSVEETEDEYRYDQLKAYKNAFASNTDFDTFTEWFIEEENEENRKKVKTRNLDYINPKLHPVRGAIEHFFTYFSDSAFSNLSSEEEQKNGNLSPLTISKNNQNINLTQLSDGEKQIILYVADIASRLAVANPSLDDTNQGYGVVLIDEIEAHLHPEWQRNIIPALCGTFPNIQFFVTTHSPQVVSNVKREHIKIIENFKVVENTPHTYGRDANNILYNIFGVEERLPQIQAKFNKLYDLIDDENTNGEAKKLMQQIKEMLGEDDPEVQRAKTYLELNA